ncbi:MAG: transposase [Clostridiales bacterium]|nr:transposase [Clostridiales bacterium]
MISKYSFEFKLEVVKDYLNGETGGYGTIAEKHGVKSNSQIENWVKNYVENVLMSITKKYIEL